MKLDVPRRPAARLCRSPARWPAGLRKRTLSRAPAPSQPVAPPSPRPAPPSPPTQPNSTPQPLQKMASTTVRNQFGSLIFCSQCSTLLDLPGDADVIVCSGCGQEEDASGTQPATPTLAPRQKHGASGPGSCEGELRREVLTCFWVGGVCVYQRTRTR